MDGTSVHRKVHIGALAMALAALPWSEFLLSLSQIILLGNWLWEGIARRDLGGRFGRALTTPASAVFLSFFGLHVLGLAWTQDLQWGLDLCRILLPVLVFGLVLPSVPRLGATQLRSLLLLGAWSAIASTVACFALRHEALELGNYRDLSPFISHIRLGLMLCLAIAVLVHYWPRTAVLRAAHVVAMVWTLWFMDQLSSLVTLPVLAVLALYGLWRLSRLQAGKWRQAAALLLLAGMGTASAFLYTAIAERQHADPRMLEHLDERSAGGEVYYHDVQAPLEENGHYVWINVADKELERTWERRSALPFWGEDKLGQPLRFTLVRYLASMGLRKDSTGVQALSDADVARVENGVTSVVQGRGNAMRDRLGQVFYELDTYRRTGDPNGHSVTMRMEFARVGAHIAARHWATGVGTGDTQPAFDAAFNEWHSPLLPQWRLRAHNEYLTLLISFGVFGLLWSLFSWWWPAWRNRAFTHPLFTAWAIIFLLSCLTEDTIETQMGATFFALYYTLFVFAAPTAPSSDRTPAAG